MQNAASNIYNMNIATKYKRKRKIIFSIVCCFLVQKILYDHTYDTPEVNHETAPQQRGIK